MFRDLKALKVISETVIFFWDGSAVGDHSKAAFALCALDSCNRVFGTYWAQIILDPNARGFLGAEVADNISAEFSGAVVTLQIILQLIREGFLFDQIILAPDLDLIRDFLSFKSRVKGDNMRALATMLLGLWGEVKEVARISWRVVKGHSGVYGNEIVNSLAQFALSHEQISYVQFYPPWLPGRIKIYKETDLRNVHRNIKVHPLVPEFLYTTPVHSCLVDKTNESPVWSAIAGGDGSGSVRLGAAGIVVYVREEEGVAGPCLLVLLLQELIRAMNRKDQVLPKSIVLRIVGIEPSIENVQEPGALLDPRFVIRQLYEEIMRRVPIITG